MRKKIAIMIFFVVIFNFCFAIAEEAPAPWYPFGLDAADSYEEAAAKLEAALPEMYFVKRFNSMEAMPQLFSLNDLPITNIVLMQPKGYNWALVLMSGVVSSTPGSIRALYDFYTGLVENVGKPTDTSPKITKRAFDGSLNEISIFSSYEVFSETVYDYKKATYTAAFGDHAGMTIDTYAYGAFYASATFRSNAKD